jgi:hypothetical protein
VEVYLRDARRTDHGQPFFLGALEKVLREQFIEHLLPDIFLETAADQIRGHLPGPETGDPDALLKRLDGALGFAIHIGNRNGQFERLLQILGFSQETTSMSCSGRKRRDSPKRLWYRNLHAANRAS